MTLLLLLTAPAFYWILGMPFLVRREEGAGLLALLLGGSVAGLAAELALVMGWPAKGVLVAAFAIALAALLRFGRNGKTLRSLRDAYGLYLAALLPALVSPFPVLGTWDGDWLFLYEAGRSVWEGGTLSAESLQRPPLFGAATAPLWLFAEGLVPYQLFATTMSAGTLGACLYALHRLAPEGPSHARILALVVAAPFFLHHTAACWGKLMAAGLLLAAATDLVRPRSPSAPWWPGVWFALAVAVHQSSLLYAPLLVAIRVATHGARMKDLAAMAGVFTVAGLVLVGFFEGWTIHQYGLERKIAANPSVAQRDPSVTLAENTLLVIATSFAGWSPLESLARWFRQADAFATTRVMSESFWFVTSWIQCLAGTFAGTFFPLLVAGGRPLLARIGREILNRRGALVGAACGLVIVLNGFLNPFHSSQGSMQTGLAGLGLAGLLILGVLLLETSPRRGSFAMGITLVAGTLPWIGLNLATMLGLALHPEFRSRFVAGSEGDWKRLVEHDLVPLGLSGFPFLQIGLLLALFLLYLGLRANLRCFHLRPNA